MVSFPLAINLYLRDCTEEELTDLLEKEHYLYVRTFYKGEGTDVNCIAVSNRSISGLNDPNYRVLLYDCWRSPVIPKNRRDPLQLRYDVIPCVIELGTLWHFVGIDKTMCKKRRVALRYDVLPPGSGLEMCYIMGLELYGRDPYPGETEEQLKDVEEKDGVFIRRR